MTGERDPQLTWSEDGEPRSARFDDVYFSAEDGLAESRAVFLKGCGLPVGWKDRCRFVVGELGFGTGLNIAALLHQWRCDRPSGGRLHIFSIEGFPMPREDAARALAHWPEIAAESAALLEVWPNLAPGFHRLDFPQWGATLDLAIGDAEWALDQWQGSADAWFLDGFSPATNPGMWSEAVLDGITARSAPGARAATFTVAGAVRRGLANRGFAVEKMPGHGRKRERLEARRPGQSADISPTVAVIGAGIAGASLARAFDALGVQVVVVESDRPGAGASGFPAGLVTPRLDAGDEAIAGLYAQALARARTLYRATPGAVLAEGVIQIEQAPRDGVRFNKIAAQTIWPSGALVRLQPEAVALRLSEPTAPGGLAFDQALTVCPQAILDGWLAPASIIRGRADRLEPIDGGWAVIDCEGRTLVQADIVVVAAGWGAAALCPELSLSPVAGQADWVQGSSTLATAWGGYVAPTADGLLFGATHVRGDEDPVVSEAASQSNRSTLAARLPELAQRIEGLETTARVAVRATTPDRLPLAGAAPGRLGLFVLGGLGSRGFCAAPILAEHVAALALGMPSPLPASLSRRVGLDRPALRGQHELRRGQ